MTVKLIYHFQITYNYIQIYKESGLGEQSGFGLSPDFVQLWRRRRVGLEDSLM